MVISTSAPTLDSTSARILEVHHPYVTVSGLDDVSVGEMVIFADETMGQVLSYQAPITQIMAFSDHAPTPGQPVARLHTQLEFPVHRQLGGAIYNPLGVMLNGPQGDHPPSTSSSESRGLTSNPVPLKERYKIHETLVTGVTLVDQLLPLGKGQRQLVTGDRKTGKTNFAIQAAIAQAREGTIIVYGLIGKKSSDIAHVQQAFQEAGVSDRVVIIASSASDSPSLIYITPMAAMTVAEYFRDQACHVLVILDDLSTHAKFYRQLSLLAKQFPGRDSYPGDVFSVHARLLERAGCFVPPAQSPTPTEGEPLCAPDTQSVSISCLPLAETTDGDLTDYIVSNLISITDGHLLFDQALFQQGQRPAIHTSLSVTRVGKQTLSPLGRDTNQKLTTFIAEYQRTQELSHFGTELREESVKILKRGQVLMDFFAMDVPLPLTVQYVLLATIWLDWWELKTDTGIAPEITHLLRNYQESDEARAWLEEVVTNNQVFGDLVDQLTVHKEQLLKLCQP